MEQEQIREPLLFVNKMLSEVRDKLARLRAKEEVLCEVQRRAEGRP